MGGSFDNSGIGAAWVWTRSNGVWTQQGNRLVGSGAVGNAAQGFSVALSGNGNTAIVGGATDNSGIGAAWRFVEGTDRGQRTFFPEFLEDWICETAWLHGALV